MSLLYRCDKCHEVKEPGDCYGPGVFTEENQGRPMNWFEHGVEDQIHLSVLPSLKEDGSTQQICGECVGKAMLEMVEEIWPTEERGGSHLAKPLTPTEYVERWGHAGGYEDYLAHWNEPFPGLRGERSGERSDNGDRADRDVPELRAVEPVPQPSTSELSRRCSSCSYQLNIEPPGWCTRKELHGVGGSSRPDGGQAG